MIFSSPPQRVQLSISTPNTRFSRRAQLIATCRGADGLVGSAPDTGGVAAQRKELLPGPWADRDAVGDRVAEQVIQRTGLRSHRKYLGPPLSRPYSAKDSCGDVGSAFGSVPSPMRALKSLNR
jgi:hypothetical protein